jgi:hypothetical protein
LKLDVARRKVKSEKLSNKVKINKNLCVTLYDPNYLFVTQSLKKKIKQLEEKFDAQDHSKVEKLIKYDVQLTDSVN